LGRRKQGELTTTVGTINVSLIIHLQFQKNGLSLVETRGRAAGWQGHSRGERKGYTSPYEDAGATDTALRTALAYAGYLPV